MSVGYKAGMFGLEVPICAAVAEGHPLCRTNCAMCQIV
jgi:hypothetical protein